MKIKVCGMKDKENIRQLVKLQPDYIGFIFHRQSGRYIGKIGQGLSELIPVNIKKTGVFVDEPIESIVEQSFRYNLDILQLHGNELPEYCEELKKLNIPVIKAFRVDPRFSFRKTEDYEHCCDYFLFDTAGKMAGGNGLQFDWELLKKYRGRLPFFLSGGIGPEDLSAVLQFSHPNFYGIDLNSRFEKAPGEKDLFLVENFIHGLRESKRI